MSDINELFYPSLKELVTQIKAINGGWKVASDLFGDNSPLSTSSRDLKSCLQVRLLRSYAPHEVYLAIDHQAEGEPLYGLRLRESVDKYEDADHLPVRVANEILLAEEINKFSRSKRNNQKKGCSMNVADVWNIVWQDTPFHWAIAIILFVAIIYEIYTLIQYYYLECSATAKGIKYLKYLNKSSQDKKAKPPRARDWLQKHFETDDGNRLKNQYLQYQKFIIKKYPTVLARSVPRSHLRFVTTLCTSIGVLGTFYGIQQGLQGINLDVSNSQQLMTSSIELLENMKTAFSTSLMGLGCGSLFTLVLFASDSLRRGLLRDLHDKLRNKLDQLATFEDEIERLRRSLNNQQPPSAEEIGKAVGESIVEQFTGLSQLTSEAIGKAVAKQMYSQLKPIYREQQKLTKQLEENQGHKVIEKLIQDLKVEVIEPVAQRLDESAELTRQASQAVTNLHNELGGISQSLASSIETIQDFQKDTLGELKEFANELKQTLNHFQIETKGVLKQTGEEINRAVDQSIVGMTAQRKAFEESASKASGLMDSAREKLLDTLGHIDQTLTATRQTVQDDLTKFREEYKNNLQAFFKEQNNLLENTLGQQRDGLAKVVTNLNTVFNDEYSRRSELAQKVNQSMDQVSTSAREVNKLVCAVGLNSGNSLVQLENIARDIGQQVQGVRGEYRQLSNTFRESLTAWTNHFGESQETFFNEADSAMANVCSSLLQTAEVLVAANNNNGNGRS